MKNFILIILASLSLFGCSGEDILIGKEKVFSYTGELEIEEKELNVLKNVCGSNAKLTIDGDYSITLRDYMSVFKCESGFEFKDTGRAFAHDSIYKLEYGVKFFIDINYENLTYEVYSYDYKFANYISESKPLDENMRALNRIIYYSFNLEFANNYKKILKEEHDEILNKEKLQRIKEKAV